jgi:16S rRNA (uracil1498-N3)-methyltransferase
VSLEDYLQQQHDTLKLIAHPGEQPLAAAALQDASDIHLLTGPEGGFSAEELEHAASSGFRSFALGQRVLRAETAPSVLLAAIWMARGE